ncbi:MAG: cytochrome c [Alphaproteobacteria bacterium]|nr:cytochrome c [Alphaproteobacteria bacterium]
MSRGITKTAARNIFFGGTIFFFIVFVALTAQSHWYIVHKSTDAKTLTASVARGKRVWEKNACIDCHTILGEGAYFAPELGKVWIKFGGDQDPVAGREALKAWMDAMPTGIKGRRQMPQFHLTEQEYTDLAAFFAWVSTIDTQNWPPKPIE